MGVHKRPGQKDYRYDLYIEGVRVSSGRTGKTTKREAEKFVEELRQQLLSEKAQMTIDYSKPLTMGEAADLYWEQKGQDASNKTDNKRNLAWLVKEITPNLLISKIDDGMVAKLVAKRRGMPVVFKNSVREAPSPATVNRSVIEPLRALLYYARKVWKQQIQIIDWSAYKQQEPQGIVRMATDEQEDAIMAQIRGDYAPALVFALKTAARRAEIVGLDWSHVDWFKGGRFTLTGKGKKGQPKLRTIPMTGFIYDLLRTQLGNHPEAVFTFVAQRASNSNSKCRGTYVRGQRYPITAAGFRTEWERTRERCAKIGINLDEFRFHDTRHTAATRFLLASKDITKVQKLLGHTEVGTTMRYVSYLEDDMRDALEAENRTIIAPSGGVEDVKQLKKKGV